MLDDHFITKQSPRPRNLAVHPSAYALWARPHVAICRPRTNRELVLNALQTTHRCHRRAPLVPQRDKCASSPTKPYHSALPASDGHLRKRRRGRACDWKPMSLSRTAISTNVSGVPDWSAFTQSPTRVRALGATEVAWAAPCHYASRLHRAQRCLPLVHAP